MLYRSTAMRKCNSTLTAERCRELFDYDPETGVLTRQVRTSNSVKAGNVAGSLNDRGELRASADGVKYLAHRLAWLHCHGVWPTQVIDHKDRNPANKRIANLQDVSQALNNQNTGSKKNSSRIYKGVSWDNARSKWVAYIKYQGKTVNLGGCIREEAAYGAYLAAAKIYYTNSNPANLQNA